MVTRNSIRLAIAGALICFGALPAALATQVRSLNLEQMTRDADRIFQGRCVQLQVVLDPTLGQVVTQAVFVPQRSAKGSVRGAVTIRLLGDQRASGEPGMATPGLPRFEEGEEVVLFLYKDSSVGLTSPVGFGQGRFKVLRDKSGRTMALNAFGNSRLLEGLTTQARQKLGSRADRWKRGGPIPPGELLDMVGELQR